MFYKYFLKPSQQNPPECCILPGRKFQIITMFKRKESKNSTLLNYSPPKKKNKKHPQKNPTNNRERGREV